MTEKNTSRVSSAWLHNELKAAGAIELEGQAADDAVRDAGMILFDATYFLTDKTRDPNAEYLEERLPGAGFFDITTIADTDSEWPNTVPTAEAFEEAVRELGCNRDVHVIAYDRLGLFSAARVWWLFRYFGHNTVSVLDGGLVKWKADQLPMARGPVSFPRGDFKASPKSSLLHTAEQVHAVIQTDNTETQIVDARGAGRFAGNSPEPRQGLRSGHIPGSLNLPYDRLLNEDKTFKSDAEIRAILDDVGIDLQKPVITTCGSGVTACILSLAFERLGAGDSAVFDGSWTEWGTREELPVATLSVSAEKS